MDLSIKLKTYVAIGVMVVCFTLLYPKIFHPMIRHALGFNHPPEKDLLKMHPREHMKQMPRPFTNVPESPFMHAQRMERISKTNEKSSSNVLTLILPIYGVGMLLYLIYNLTKAVSPSTTVTETPTPPIPIPTTRPTTTRPIAEKSPVTSALIPSSIAPPSKESILQDKVRRESGKAWRRQCYRDICYGSHEEHAHSNLSKALPEEVNKLITKMEKKSLTLEEIVILRKHLENAEQHLLGLLKDFPDQDDKFNLDQNVHESAEELKEANEKSDEETDETETRCRRFPDIPCD